MQKPNNVPEKLVNLFEFDLPGSDAHQFMLAKPVDSVPLGIESDKKIPSAVLILLYPTQDEIRFILTKRTMEVEHHKGQISLPGGVKESNETLTETALRETWEELGINPDDIHVFGSLSPLHVKISGFEIQPFVGWMNEEPSIVPHAGEVEDVFSISLGDLLNDESRNEDIWTIRGYKVHVPFFMFNNTPVWGATAMILSEFRELIKQGT